ncbi:PREDICTED: vicilin-like seed storage protein At3g22640 [Tarenaya hassleriana]|uniref:vicilin-like seed storage protein At3g22640 n=1 Tax=Tarenaya hassleriana TaxID=28532 RepID=UPI00053C2576|nr:PREDICTED: vicilin-like seed storage protein At3g22640 [Tarenaya hassleriana]
MAMTRNNLLTITIALLFFSLASGHSHRVVPPETVAEDEFPPQPHAGGVGGWEHPFYFGQRSFQTLLRSKEGFMKLLPSFTSRSWLFRGIENYRFAFLKMAPRTFVQPHHPDADVVFVVLQGKGVAMFLTQEEKETFHIEKGHVVRMPAGTTHYVANTGDDEPLRLAAIFVPVNIPGSFQVFFPAAAEFQQSYFDGFSSKVLSASFNVSEELLGRFLRGPQTGRKAIQTISPEEIKELRKHVSSEKHKHQGRLWSPFDIHSQEPVYSNEFGRFYEAHPERFRQLRDLGISVTCINMTQGSIFVPHFSSKATFIVFVESGCARFEMAKPHIGSGQWQQQQQEGPQWGGQGQEQQWGEQEMTGKIHRVVSQVCKGELFVIPASHPVAIITQDQNFTAVGFGINAHNSSRTFLAGQGNILSKLDTAEKRLTFGVGKEVSERVFTSQDYSYFVPTHQRRQQKPSFQSIFNYAGY